MVSTRTNLPLSDKERPLFRVLDTVGDGSGSEQANVDGSVTPVQFRFVPPDNQSYGIASLHGIIRDDAPGNAWTAENYGGVPILTNGVTIAVYNKETGEPLYDLLDGYTVRSNAGWGLITSDTNVTDFGTGDNFLSFTWRLAEDLVYHPLYLTDDEFIAVTINDDLTGLVDHLFNVRGWRYL